jgi:hypothetical protein
MASARARRMVVGVMNLRFRESNLAQMYPFVTALSLG